MTSLQTQNWSCGYDAHEDQEGKIQEGKKSLMVEQEGVTCISWKHMISVASTEVGHTLSRTIEMSTCAGGFEIFIFSETTLKSRPPQGRGVSRVHSLRDLHFNLMLQGQAGTYLNIYFCFCCTVLTSAVRGLWLSNTSNYIQTLICHSCKQSLKP